MNFKTNNTQRSIALALIITMGACTSKNSKDASNHVDSNKTQYALNTGVKDGLQTETYANGNKKFEGNMKDGKRTGEWFMYFENGTIWSRCNYVNDKKQGKSVVYLPSGAKAYEGMYEQDEPIGEWTYYNENGTVVKKVKRK
jgi:antitoxin component YwqK of YwqJK toxin-antitoxin module